MQINDPNGRPAKVTEDNRLRTYAGQESEIAFQSRVNGNAYEWSMSANLGANKGAIYLRNDSEIPLVIDKIFIYGNAAATFEFYLGANTASPAGTAITGVNLNTKYLSRIAQVTATHTETDLDDGGGLTLLKTIQAGVSSKETIDYEGALTLERLGEIGIRVVTDIDLTSISILGYFQPVV